MRSIRFVFFVAMSFATLSISHAQRMMMMGGGGGGMSQGMVLFAFSQDGPSIRSDVSKELKLDDGQKGKLGEMQQKQMDEMMNAFQSGERPSQEQMQAMLKKRQEAEDKTLRTILNETQQKRLRELWIQRLGNGAVANPELQKELGVTEAQLTSIKTLMTKQQEANNSIREKMMNGEIDRSEIRPLFEKNAKALNEELGKLLTTDQAAKLKAMGGAPFKFDADNIG